MKKTYAVAIDGPSGAGKSTIARAVAGKFGFMYVDTGAIYRCVGLAALRAGVDKTDPEAVQQLLQSLQIELHHDGAGVQQMILNGENVSGQIRTPEVSLAASDFSALPAVRAFLLDMQRAFARRYSVIMDGRDIGTVVLPDADLKIFLTASSAERARRRFDELTAKGMNVDYETVLREQLARDAQDSGRAVAPLKAAQDAVIVDTTGKTLDESIALVLSVMEERLCL